MKKAIVENGLYSELRGLIATAKERASVAVNAELSMLYWNVGKRINEEVLGNKRADYGARIVDELSARLMVEFGPSWNAKQLRRMMQFATVFPDHEIVVSLIRELSWTHIIALIPLTDQLKREFYAEICKVEHWSVRTLRNRIASMMYERTAIAGKPDAVIKKELASLRKEKKMSPNSHSAIRIFWIFSVFTANIRKKILSAP